MRKITILAIATAALAVVTVVTDLIRADMSAKNSKVSANAVVEQAQTAGGLNAKKSFNAI
jgi:NAD(P)H-dependent flavin oxidoreductase YrpB (nitropropane dioxygenase family)